MASARENDLNPDVYIGLKLPFTRGRSGLFPQSENTLEQAGSNIKNLLLTAKGERVMQPDFGSRLRELLFEQYTEELRLQIENEIIENRVSYMPIGRLWKYTEAPYHDFYDEGDRLWFYPASRSPGSSLSVDAFYETDTFKFKLLELKNHSSVRFPLNLPHHYEDIFHESKNNGVKNLGDIMCAIPKQVILMHEQPETETRLNK